MKNYDLMVTGLVDSMFEDMASAISLSSVCLIKSRIILSQAYKDRGLPFYTITLPSCGKFLEKSLETSRLGEDRPPYHGGLSKDDIRPRFLHGVWSLIFSGDGNLLSDPDVTAIIWLRQIYYVLKKFDMDCAQEYVDAEISQYLHIESELPSSWPHTWDDDHPEWSPRNGHPLWGSIYDSDSRQNQLPGLDLTVHSNPLPWEKFRHLCGVMSSALGEFDVWALRPKHGPGAIAERYRTVKYEFKAYPRKLSTVFPPDYFASHDLIDRSESDCEYPSVMHAVPKTQKGPRLIAAEPSAHQWIQGGIQRWLEERCKSSFLKTSIDFRNQEESKVLALEASRTQAYATVDLSAASDRLSTRLVEYVFQANRGLLDALHASRSRMLLIPKGISPSLESDLLLKLRKFAPMGSACTFPIQTIVFTMIGHFALCLADDDWDMSADSLRRRASRLRVFGDDIIIDNNAYSHLVRILSDVGLKVNEGKSFHQGFFREACGMDAYNGVDVTPAYLRKLYRPSSPESLVSVVECSNNFHKKAMWSTAAWILKTVPEQERKTLALGRKDIGSVSLFTFTDGPISPIKRWNKDYHDWEFRVLTITGKTTLIRGTGEALLLQYFSEEPDPLIDWQAGQAGQTRFRKRIGWVRA